MKNYSKIKVVYLFNDYPVFYQPYIPPVVESLKKEEGFNIEINAYKGNNDKNLIVFPSYYRRKLKEKYYGITKSFHPKLNYTEISFIHKNIDIVHIQHSYLFTKIINLLAFPILNRPKIIITLRGGDTYVKPWIQKKWTDFYLNYGNKIDAFIVMSVHQKNYLHTKWGIDEERIHVIPISFGSKFLVFPKIPDVKKIKVFSMFRMCWEKNIDGNLRVIKYLHEKGLPVEYSIYGDGPDTGQLLYLIDKYNLTSCVKYKGKVANSVLKKQISNYDFLLQLSHSEAFPTSVLEAQSFGIPAVVSNSGGLPEVVISNKTGFCVDTNDSLNAAEYIESLWKEPELYKNFSAEAINFAQSNFAIENEVERLTNLYLKLF